jgi:hypothetical protein
LASAASEALVDQELPTANDRVIAAATEEASESGVVMQNGEELVDDGRDHVVAAHPLIEGCSRLGHECSNNEMRKTLMVRANEPAQHPTIDSTSQSVKSYSIGLGSDCLKNISLSQAARSLMHAFGVARSSTRPAMLQCLPHSGSPGGGQWPFRSQSTRQARRL